MYRQPEVIRYLASLELQQQFIVEGTKDEYILPEELVEDALGLIEDIRTGRRGSDLTAFQLEKFEDLAAALEANSNVDDRPLSDVDLIQSPQWVAIRSAAQGVLAALDE